MPNAPFRVPDFMQENIVDYFFPVDLDDRKGQFYELFAVVIGGASDRSNPKIEPECPSFICQAVSFH